MAEGRQSELKIQCEGNQNNSKKQRHSDYNSIRRFSKRFVKLIFMNNKTDDNGGGGGGHDITIVVKTVSAYDLCCVFK